MVNRCDFEGGDHEAEVTVLGLGNLCLRSHCGFRETTSDKSRDVNSAIDRCSGSKLRVLYRKAWFLVRSH